MGIVQNVEGVPLNACGNILGRMETFGIIL